MEIIGIAGDYNKYQQFIVTGIYQLNNGEDRIHTYYKMSPPNNNDIIFIDLIEDENHDQVKNALETVIGRKINSIHKYESENEINKHKYLFSVTFK